MGTSVERERLAVPYSLVAFDPGVSTGIAVFHRGMLYASYTLKLTDDAAYVYRSISNLLAPHPFANRVIVCENYVALRTLDRNSRQTVELIGWIHGVALCDGTPFYLQMPGAKLPWLPEAKAELQRAFSRAGNDHERDALAHGFAWLAAHTTWRTPSNAE